MSSPSDIVRLPAQEVDPPVPADDDSSVQTESSRPSAPVVVARPDLTEASDAQLMQMIGTGDRTAFSAFCRRHAARCLSIAQHLLRNSADAEEVVQEVFLRVWQNAGRLRDKEARVTTWLYRVVVNLCLDWMRRAKRPSVSLDYAADVAALGPNPESIVGQREFARIVGRAVADLPPRQRAALNLVVYQGLDYAEAAKVMEVSTGTIKSLLVRGRRQLRAVLAEADQDRPGKTEPKPAASRTDKPSEPVVPPMGVVSGARS